MTSLLDLLIPPACAGCGRAGDLLCQRCARSMRPPSHPDDAFVAADPGAVVGSALLLAVGALAYEGATRRALGRLKYAGAGRVARPLADVAAPALVRLLALTGPATLVPVPVHAGRQRARGYNQAALLATALARPLGLPVSELLVRRHATARQHRLDRAARLRNLRDAISIRDGVRLPEAVILIDDILTTSATLEACAGVLQAGGVGAAYGFAIAREV